MMKIDLSSEKIIVTEDIFMKAAIRYCERIGVNPNEKIPFQRDTRDIYRDEMEELFEKIAALKEVGALQK